MTRARSPVAVKSGVFRRSWRKPTLLSVDGNDTLLGTLDYGTQRIATGTMGFKHMPLDIEAERRSWRTHRTTC